MSTKFLENTAYLSKENWFVMATDKSGCDIYLSHPDGDVAAAMHYELKEYLKAQPEPKPID